MNYKNNLLTKKKYKIVNQKGGIGLWAYWTFCARYTDYFPNRFSSEYIPFRSPPNPFDIKIGKEYWPSGFGGNYYSISNANGVLDNLKMNEEQFIEFLLNRNIFLSRLGFNDDFGNDNYNKNLCILYHIAFFEECIPKPFQQLYSKILENNSFKNKFTNSHKLMNDTVINLQEWKKNHSDNKLSFYEEQLFKVTRPESDLGTVIQEMDKCATKFTKPISLTPCPKDKKYDSCKEQDDILQAQAHENFKKSRQPLLDRVARRGIILKQ